VVSDLTESSRVAVRLVTQDTHSVQVLANYPDGQAVVGALPRSDQRARGHDTPYRVEADQTDRLRTRKPSPSRRRLHRAAAILNDRNLHELANNDVFWEGSSGSRASANGRQIAPPLQARRILWRRGFRYRPAQHCAMRPRLQARERVRGRPSPWCISCTRRGSLTAGGRRNYCSRRRLWRLIPVVLQNPYVS